MGSPSNPRRRHPRRRFLPEVLTNTEVLALLDACGSHLTGVRNRALLALLYWSGLRLGEALQIRPKDLDLDSGAVRVLYGKGGYNRTVGIDPGAAELIRAWLAARRRWSHLPPSAPVFCTAWGKPLAQGYVAASTTHRCTRICQEGGRSAARRRPGRHAMDHKRRETPLPPDASPAAE
jgi:integrase